MKGDGHTIDSTVCACRVIEEGKWKGHYELYLVLHHLRGTAAFDAFSIANVRNLSNYK